MSAPQGSSSPPLRSSTDRPGGDPESTSDRSTSVPYQYVVLRCVPRVDREEFVNVGVVLYCQAAEYLDVTWRCDADRLRAVDPSLDVERVCDALVFVERVCAGDERGGEVAGQPLTQRFGFLKAPRSTVIQPGPVHGGVTADPARELDHLFSRLVG
jgi:hypothetical protein